jgi:hypothetical protein
MKKETKEYLGCVLGMFLFCAIIIGLVCCISYFPKLNQAFANATGANATEGNPLPWKETKKILMTRLPLLIPFCFGAGFMMYAIAYDGVSGEDNDEEGNDDEKKN